MQRSQQPSRTGIGLATALVLALLSTSCGLAESIAEGFIDDQDYELYAGGSTIGTLLREVDGTDVTLHAGVLLPGDTADDQQALGIVGFGFDRGLQPDKTRLEWVLLRFWVEPAEGDVTPLGPLIVSHLPDAEDVLETGLVPNPPGDDIATLRDVTTEGWRDVDVSEEFLQEWNAGRSLAAFVLRFTTLTDDGADEDRVDLFPEVDGAVRRAHLVLHFGVDL